MNETRRRSRGPLLGAALGLAAALLASCTPSSSGVQDVTSSTGPATTVVTAEADGPAVLAAALDSARQGYSFESTVTLDGELVTTIAGRSSGNAIQAIVESGGAEVEYLLTPDGRWIREPGEGWVALAEEAPFDDPLATLGSFQSIEVAEVQEDRTVLVATYPAPSLGLEGEGDVEIEIVVVHGQVSRVSYDWEVQKRPLRVVSTFTDVGTAPPVTAPDA